MKLLLVLMMYVLAGSDDEDSPRISPFDPSAQMRGVGPSMPQKPRFRKNTVVKERQPKVQKSNRVQESSALPHRITIDPSKFQESSGIRRIFGNSASKHAEESRAFKKALLQKPDKDEEGISVTLRQLNGLDEIRNMIFKVMFTNSLLQKTINDAFQENPFQESSNWLYGLAIRDMKFEQIRRSKEEELSFHNDEVHLALRNVKLKLSFKLYARGLVIPTASRIIVTFQSVSAEAVLKPEYKRKVIIHPDSLVEKEVGEPEFNVTVEHFKLSFDDRVTFDFPEQSVLNWKQRVLTPILNKVIPYARGLANNYVTNFLKESLSKFLQDLVHTQTETILNLFDDLISQNYGIQLNVAKHFKYQQPYLELKKGSLNAGAILKLENIEEIRISDDRYNEIFSLPRPARWNTGSDEDSKEGWTDRVDLRKDPPYQPYEGKGCYKSCRLMLQQFRQLFAKEIQEHPELQESPQPIESNVDQNPPRKWYQMKGTNENVISAMWSKWRQQKKDAKVGSKEERKLQAALQRQADQALKKQRQEEKLRLKEAKMKAKLMAKQDREQKRKIGSFWSKVGQWFKKLVPKNRRSNRDPSGLPYNKKVPWWKKPWHWMFGKKHK